MIAVRQAGRETGWSEIGATQLLSAFATGIDAPASFHETLQLVDTRYRLPTRAEAESYILDSLQRAASGRPAFASDNQQAFERGWQASLRRLRDGGDPARVLRPGYFRSATCLRFRQGIIIPADQDLEYSLFVLSRLLIFSEFLAGAAHVYEFGCGSCANLVMLAGLFPETELQGLDFTESPAQIVAELGRAGQRLSFRHFDMLDPDRNCRLEPDSVVLTVHAMEQLGGEFKPFLDYLLQMRPALVVNYEPVQELYDPENLYDLLAINYSRRRGYLNGYLTALRDLEGQGRVRILRQVRPQIGGVLHESSLLVWRPT